MIQFPKDDNRGFYRGLASSELASSLIATRQNSNFPVYHSCPEPLRKLEGGMK